MGEWTRIDKGQKRDQRATICLTQATRQNIYKAKRKVGYNTRPGRVEGGVKESGSSETTVEMRRLPAKMSDR